MKLFLPFMLVGIAVSWRRTLLVRWRQVVLAAMIGLILVAPMLYLHVRDYDKMQARYRAVAVFQPDKSFDEAALEVLHNIANNLSPDFLFGRGDHDEIYHPKGIGQLYLAQAVLVLLGAMWGIAQRDMRPTILLLGLWILLGVLPAALTIHRPGSGSGNAGRALLTVVPWQLLSGLSATALLKLIPSRRICWGIGLTLSLWVGYDAWGYFGYYFGDYAVDAYRHFDSEMGAIMAQAAPLADEYDTVYLTCLSGDFPYTQILFYTQYDPRLLQTDLPDRGDWLFAPVWRVGKYHIVCDTVDLWEMGLPGLYVVPEDELPDVAPLITIPTQPGQRAYKLIARRTFAYDFAALPWLGQCTQPLAPLNASQLAQNAPQTHIVEFDCASTWIYPSVASANSDAYLLHSYLLSGTISDPPQNRAALDPFIQRHLQNAKISFNMPKFTREFPAFVIYANTTVPTTPSPLPSVASPAADLPLITTSLSLSPSITLQGPFTFLGLDIYPDETDVEIESWWRVTTTTPITRPLSLMAHWLTIEGEVLGIADGLGVAPSMLRIGDIVVQRHRFTEIPAEAAGWLRVGGYWLDTMERWPITGAGKADAIFVLIER